MPSVWSVNGMIGTLKKMILQYLKLFGLTESPRGSVFISFSVLMAKGLNNGLTLFCMKKIITKP